MSTQNYRELWQKSPAKALDKSQLDINNSKH